ncbi:MAG: hypothetical protein QME12_02040 [Nanoarchaeota archaeon]|nr:hypothetical protein [Nanoarchaeota archaeon]
MKTFKNNGNMRKRKKRASIYQQIADYLRSGEFTILQVANAVGLNWETARNAIQTLEQIKIVSSHEKNGKTYYYMDESQLIVFNENTLMGLPMDKVTEAKTEKLFGRIVERWRLLNPDRPINKTFLQKMLVRLIKEAGIKDIPFGWYLFGECAVMQYAPCDSVSHGAEQFDLPIDAIIKDYSRFTTTKELLNHYYTQAGNELYLARIKLSDILNVPFTEESIAMLKRNLRTFLFSFVKTEENGEIIEYLNGFASMVTRLINNVSINQLEDYREDISAAFMAIWEIMATYNLYESLLKQGLYAPSVLKKHYTLQIENLKCIANNYLGILDEYCPIMNVKSSLERFKGILEKQPQ